MFLHHLLLTVLTLLLLAGNTGAEEKPFDRIPDLAQLVSNPIRGTYRLVCPQNIASAINIGGFSVVPRPGGPIRLVGFDTLTLVLMVKPGKPSDKIATVLLVDLCIESETSYTIVSGRDKQMPRDHPGLSHVQQKTRPL